LIAGSNPIRIRLRTSTIPARPSDPRLLSGVLKKEGLAVFLMRMGSKLDAADASGRLWRICF